MVSFIKKIYESKEVVALGHQLIIVDVQEIFPASEKLLAGIIDYAKNFDDIIYVYDVMSVGEHNNKFDMFKKLKDSGHLKARMKVHEKEFGFLRPVIDEGDYSEQQIQSIVRFMYNMKLHDIRDMDDRDDYEVWDEYKEEFGLQQYDSHSAPAFLPDYIYSLIKKVRPNAHLVGGGRKECLKEIELVLKALDLRPKVIEKLTYG